MAAKKKVAEKKPATKKSALYKIEGDKLSRLSRFCPKCGPGIFMAKHKDGRFACGKCGFMEKP